MTDPLVLRAPMRARSVAAPAGSAAARGLATGTVGIGEPLARAPRNLDAAVEATDDEHGAKAARMLERFSALEDGTLCWTRDPDGLLHLGMLAGPWRYDAAAAARAAGIVHVRPVRWLDRPWAPEEVPDGVLASFARGGRNLQAIRDPGAARRSAELWASAAR